MFAGSTFDAICHDAGELCEIHTVPWSVRPSVLQVTVYVEGRDNLVIRYNSTAGENQVKLDFGPRSREYEAVSMRR